MSQFHDSTALVNVIIGARGVGKTTGLAVDEVGHCWHSSGARCVNVRKSEKSQDDTTIHTFNIVYEQMGDLYKDTGTSLFKSLNGGKLVRVPSARAVEAFNNFNALRERSKSETVAWLETEGNRLCGTIEFRGLPHATISQNKLRGLECSYMGMIEADLLERRDLELAIPTLRWKGSDPDTCDERGFIKEQRIVLDTNPPSPSHWIAEMEKEWKAGRLPNYRFWHIATRENQANLPPGYVENLEQTYRNNPALYDRYVLGEYADAFEGKAVLWAFNSAVHARSGLTFPRGAYLVRGYDFGTNNSIVWSAYFELDGYEYWWDLHEYFQEGSDTETQARAAVQITEEEFPFFNDRSICAGILDYCDPAGNNSNFGVSNPNFRSSVSILKTYGISPGFARMPFKTRVTIANRLLEARDAAGNPCYLLDKDSCPMLYRASQGAWRYPALGEPGYGLEYPVKGALCGNVDHIADAATYSRANCLKLIKAEVERINKPVGVLGKKPSDPNPDRWRR